MAREKLTAEEAAGWFALWLKHKNKVYGLALLIIGALGGNVETIVSAFPDVHDVAGLRKQVVVLEEDVQKLKDSMLNVGINPDIKTDDGFKVNRPTK